MCPQGIRKAAIIYHRADNALFGEAVLEARRCGF